MFMLTIDADARYVDENGPQVPLKRVTEIKARLKSVIPSSS